MIGDFGSGARVVIGDSDEVDGVKMWQKRVGRPQQIWKVSLDLVDFRSAKKEFTIDID